MTVMGFYLLRYLHHSQIRYRHGRIVRHLDLLISSFRCSYSKMGIKASILRAMRTLVMFCLTPDAYLDHDNIWYRTK